MEKYCRGYSIHKSQEDVTMMIGQPPHFFVKDACKKHIEVGVLRKYQDHITMMIVQLPHFLIKENETIR